MDGNGWMEGWGEVGVGVLEVWKQLKLDHWVQNQGGKNQRGRKNISRRRGGGQKSGGGTLRGSHWKKSEMHNSGEMFLTC